MVLAFVAAQGQWLLPRQLLLPDKGCGGTESSRAKKRLRKTPSYSSCCLSMMLRPKGWPCSSVLWCAGVGCQGIFQGRKEGHMIKHFRRTDKVSVKGWAGSAGSMSLVTQLGSRAGRTQPIQEEEYIKWLILLVRHLLHICQYSRDVEKGQTAKKGGRRDYQIIHTAELF